MIKSKLLASFVLLFSMFALSGMMTSCTNTNHQESTGQFIDSSAITAKVKSRLLADKVVRGLPITVTTYKNGVQLSGFVDNRRQKMRAVRIARNVPGVREVQDSLIIKKH